MADEPENLTLRYLRSMDEKLDRIHSKAASIENRCSALEIRLTSLDTRLVSIDMRLDGMQADIAEQGLRLERVERRLGIIEGV